MARGWGAFRVSQPAVEDFPHRVWLRLVARHSRDHRQGVLGYGDPMGHVPADLVPRFVAAREASDTFPRPSPRPCSPTSSTRMLMASRPWRTGLGKSGPLSIPASSDRLLDRAADDRRCVRADEPRLLEGRGIGDSPSSSLLCAVLMDRRKLATRTSTTWDACSFEGSVRCGGRGHGREVDRLEADGGSYRFELGLTRDTSHARRCPIAPADDVSPSQPLVVEGARGRQRPVPWADASTRIPL